MAPPPFSAEATPSASNRIQVRPFLVPPASPHPGARSSPAESPRFRHLRVRDRHDCQHLVDLASASSTFAASADELLRDEVTIDWQVGPLPASAAGGRTRMEAGGRKFSVVLDPHSLAPGVHIFEVFFREYGWVVALNRIIRTDYSMERYHREFINDVQAELGLRLSFS